MPLHLEPRDVAGEVAPGVASVLIVSCPVCPPVSLAIQKGSPLLEVFKTGLRTPAFEGHIRQLRHQLEQRGVRTGVLSMLVPLPTMCLWTQGQRRRLLKRARGFEAVLVLGCDSATHTVRQALEGTGCQILQAMDRTGITNAKVRFKLPMTIRLEETTCLGEDGGAGRRPPGS